VYVCAGRFTAKSCPRGMQYSECLPKIQRTCATLYSVVSFSTDAESGQCFPGCHCPAGKLLHAGECVKPKDCPCQYQKQFYSAGQVVKIDCNYWSARFHLFDYLPVPAMGEKLTRNLLTNSVTFLAHQHKAAGKKTRLDIQNYGCNGNLLCYHSVVARNRISSLQSHGKALENECCLPGIFCDRGDTPA